MERWSYGVWLDPLRGTRIEISFGSYLHDVHLLLSFSISCYNAV